MTFAKIGWYCAVLITLFSIVNLGIAAFIAFIDDPEARAFAAKRYLGGRSSGQVLEMSLYGFLFGICLGIFSNIAEALRAITEKMCPEKD